MIDEEITVRMFGYTSDMLAWKSHKKIVVMCDECGVHRLVEKRHSYETLCKSCINFLMWKDPIQRKQMIDAQLKRYEDPKERQKQSDGLIHRYEDPKEREKQSIRQKKSYKDNPERAKKHSIFIKNNPITQENRSSQKGIPKSESSKQRLSATLQGIPYDEWESFAKEQLYCPKFNESCRESNREKYNRECFLCGKPESENITITGKQRKFSVHHTDMDKGQGCDGARWRLVPLSMEYHGKAHSEPWKSRIIWLLENVWDNDEYRW